jgi:hypothetical protein
LSNVHIPSSAVTPTASASTKTARMNFFMTASLRKVLPEVRAPSPD